MNAASSVAKAAESIFGRIEQAAQRVSRDPKSIQLVAVSKHQSVEKMRAYHEVSHRFERTCVFGENYVQEYREKSEQLADISPCAHFIGGLQKNKAREAVQLFDLIQSVDSIRLAEALEKEAAKQKIKQKILLQVNISHDAAKSGIEPAALESAARHILESFRHLHLCGLMTITKLYEVPEEARGDFRSLAVLNAEISKVLKIELPVLSMGMSADFEVAIEEGATCVRVGTAIFGER